MFSIKGRHYKVEYEGLHLLCLSCGKFGHCAKVCGEKKAVTLVEDGEKKPIIKGEFNNEGKQKMEILGTWSVFQKYPSKKTKLNKKYPGKNWQAVLAKNTPAKNVTINARAKNTRLRLICLLKRN